jgi:hypothetical protein
MEVMAEANEQPALLNQRMDEGKRARGPRNAAGARKPSAAKSGVRRTKKPVKQQESHSAENNNSSGQDTPQQEEFNDTNSQISLPLPPSGEKAMELNVPAADRHSPDSNEVAEHSATATTVSPRFQEEPPVVEAPKYEPVFGEGLIEVSGKGFGFLRDPKRNYTQSPQDIFVTPEVVRKHALRDGLWIKGEIRRGSRGPQLFKLTQINGEDPETTDVDQPARKGPARNRAGPIHDACDGFDDAYRQRTARTDCGTPADRKDDIVATDCRRRCEKSSGNEVDYTSRR